MSNFMITPDPAAVINVGKVTSYADAVAGGYQGTREDWERDLAALGTTAAEVAANRQAVAEDKAAVEGNVTTVEEYKDAAAQSAAAAAQSAESAHTDALAATAAKEAAQTAQGIAVEARADAVSAKGAAENAQSAADTSASAAAGSALVAQNAAQTATTQAGAASDSATAAAASADAAAESARTLTIDTTLTQAGQAAEAKAVGENVADLKSAIQESQILISRQTTRDYQIGGIFPSTGTVSNNLTNRCRTNYFTANKNLIANKIPSGIKLTFRFYHYDIDTNTYVYDGGTDWITEQVEAQRELDSTASTQVRVVYAYTDDRDMTEMTDFSDFTDIIVYRYSQYDKQEIPFYLKGTIQNTSITGYRTTPYFLIRRGDTVHYSVWMRGDSKYMAVYSVDKVEKLSKLGEGGVTQKFVETYTATEEYEYIRLTTMHSSNQYYVEDGFSFIENLLDRAINNAIGASGEDSESVLLDKKPLAILCAKEIRYNDGTKPTIEFYLLADSDNNVYISNDLINKHKIFKFTGKISKYKFGVRRNNDIIAVYRNEFDTVTQEYGPNLDNVRQNPFVFIAEEHYETQHEVDFGTFDPNTRQGLKPTAWLENVGFCSLPNGDIIFAEYTREGVVYTANCWKIRTESDIEMPENWVVKKQFFVAQNDQLDLDESYIEHFHSVQHDPYTGTVYITTGDLGRKSQIYYSENNGETFTQQAFVDPDTGNTVTSGQKLFRLLNINFSENDVYWSSDSSSEHVVIHCERSVNGGLKPDSISVLTSLPNLSGTPATYGTVYFEELNALVLMESCDTAYTEMAFRVFDLTSNTTKTMCIIKSVGGVDAKIGFRTEYTEFDPIDGVIKVGYGNIERYAHKNAICGNAGGNVWNGNINNLNIRIFEKSDGSFVAKFGCYYL